MIYHININGGYIMEQYKCNIYNKHPFLYLIDEELYVIGQMVFHEVDKYNVELRELYNNYIVASNNGNCEEIKEIMKQIIFKCRLIKTIPTEDLEKHIEDDFTKEQRELLEEQVKLYTANYENCYIGFI